MRTPWLCTTSSVRTAETARPARPTHGVTSQRDDLLDALPAGGRALTPATPQRPVYVALLDAPQSRDWRHTSMTRRKPP